MNVLRIIRQMSACAALIAIAGGCNQPEATGPPPSASPSPRSATISITPAANTNAPPVAVAPQPSVEISLPPAPATPATPSPVSVPGEPAHGQFIASMEQELKTVGTNIAVLNQRVNKIEANAKIQADQDLSALNQKYQYAREQLTSLKGTTGVAWDNAKESMVHVLETLKDAYKDVAAEFTQDGVM